MSTEEKDATIEKENPEKIETNLEENSIEENLNHVQSEDEQKPHEFSVTEESTEQKVNDMSN